MAVVIEEDYRHYTHEEVMEMLKVLCTLKNPVVDEKKIIEEESE